MCGAVNARTDAKIVKAIIPLCDDLAIVVPPTDDHLVADLALLGVLFLRTFAAQEAMPPLASATLLAGLAVSADARGRRTLIPLLPPSTHHRPDRSRARNCLRDKR